MKDYDRIARKITIVLFLSQSLSSAGFIAAFTVNALVGVDLSGKQAMAGVPGGILAVGQTCGAMVWGLTMERIGRRLGLALGQVVGVVGSVIAVAAVVDRSFPFFLFGLFLIGMARSAVDLGRFAAAEVYLPANCQLFLAVSTLLAIWFAAAAASPGHLTVSDEPAGQTAADRVRQARGARRFARCPAPRLRSVPRTGVDKRSG